MIAAFLGRFCRSAAIVVIALWAATTAASAQSGLFSGLNGAWTGSGYIELSNGTKERIRCRATYDVGTAGKAMHQALRCASDSYNFDLTGQFSADDGNRITGQWTERTRNIGGSVIGTVRGDRLQVHVESSGFAADLSMVTRGRRQSVSIDSQGGGQIVKASITLNRR